MLFQFYQVVQHSKASNPTYFVCRINISSSLCAPDEWGELVPSFLTLKVRHLVAFTFYHVFYRVMVLNPYQCGFVLGDLESVSA